MSTSPVTRLYRWLDAHPRLKWRVRALLAALLARLPPALATRCRCRIERAVYAATPCVDTLPPIFHYWSSRHLQPRLQAAGCASPADFFHRALAARAAAGESLRCLSLGSGRCELEIALAQQLREAGRTMFSFHCVDLNPVLLAAAAEAARAAGVTAHFRFEVADLGDATFARDAVDVVIANQCLHHLQRLEAVFDGIARCLAPGGCVLVSDVIGRNGHRLWPEVQAVVDALWPALPPRLRRDRQHGGASVRFVDHDHSDVGFEGIRAQDILPLLVQRFDFETFIAWGGVIQPFVERRFGSNYDPSDPADAALIDRIALLDRALLARGEITPTQLLATLRRRGELPPAAVAAANARAAAAVRDPRAAAPSQLRMPTPLRSSHRPSAVSASTKPSITA